MKSFTIEIVSQEKHILTETIQQLTVNTLAGEITVLADHIPLFSKLKAGELTYVKNKQQQHFAVTGGFIDVSPRNVVTILADSAIRSDEINLQKAEEAIENAKKALEESDDIKDTLKIEMELRNAVLQASIAKKHQHKNR